MFVVVWDENYTTLLKGLLIFRAIYFLYLSLKASPTMTRGWQLNRAKRQPTADEARRVSGIPMRPPVFSSVKKKKFLRHLS